MDTTIASNDGETSVSGTETTGPTTEEALQILKDEYEKLQLIVRHLIPDKTGFPFICGHGGEKDINGMPERLWVCPSYGSDAMVVYKRSSYV